MDIISIKKILLSVLATIIFIFISISFWILYPSNFDKQEIQLEQGTNTTQVALELRDKDIIRSSIVLRGILKFRGTGGKLVPGEYLFDKPQNIFAVASRITNGDFEMPQKKVTIPEGSTNVEISKLILKTFPNFDVETFLNGAGKDQGYLFPETYFFLSTSTDDIIKDMTTTFDTETHDLQMEVKAQGKNWNDVVILASILEGEVRTTQDRKIVSGILQKRLSMGMGLQVDVSPITYKQTGLPEYPISNPGLDTLDAVVNPTDTAYLYYLTGTDGLMHYSKDFNGHKKNIQKYLK